MVTKLSFLFVSFRVKLCEIKIKKWNQFGFETVLLDNFCQNGLFFLDQFLFERFHWSCRKTERFHMKLFKNTTLNLYFQKYRDYKAWNSVSNCNEKNVITFENLHGCKKTKKTVSKHEKLWQFWKIGNTFLIFRFFFANVKKKSKFKTKKTKIMQQFQLIFFKNTLVQTIF